MKHRVWALQVCTLALAIFVLLPGCSRQVPLSNAAPNSVGLLGANRYLTPTGQLLTPAGLQIELPGLRPQALVLSPDSKFIATAGKSNVLVLISARTGEIVQKVALSTNKLEAKAEANAAVTEDPTLSPETTSPPSTKPKTTNTPPNTSKWQLSFTGIIFSPDGRRLYVSTIGGFIRVFAVEKDGSLRGLAAYAVPEAKAPKEKKELPTGLAVSADGQRLYVAGNLGNKLHEMNAHTGKPLRSWETGVAPFDVVLVGEKAYVSNQGGRRPGKTDLTAPAGKGTTVRVDSTRNIASEGTVSVIDLAVDRVKTEIPVELHASALALSPNKKYLAVANTGSDTISVIDTTTEQVVEKIWTRQSPADLFGAQPNALAFHANGKQLFVCNGTQNAVGVIQFEPEDKQSRLTGLIPVGWFPGAIAFDSARNALCVGNIKGIGATRIFKPGQQIKRASKDYFGTLSIVPLPSERALANITAIALRNIRYPMLAEAVLAPRPDQPPRPVPKRAGEPSVFKHVIYVLKENRTYDQVLGDMPEGNGNTNLCTFGEKFTPNQHKIAREFVLLDNTYCAGAMSADGHQWTDSAIANSYVERQVTSDFPRSYPGGKVEDGVDALAWSSAGFIWDNALAHGKTFRNYGEWMISQAGWRDKSRKPGVQWTNFWEDFTKAGTNTYLKSKPGLETLRPYSPTNTVGWDLKVPDVWRAVRFIEELHQFETNGGFPNFILLFLPNDHTGGTKGKDPTPGAQIADNDLAFGRVVEAVSHSKFWADTCIFAIEDDPQAGWDHVSGYRTTCYVVSPYTKRGQTVSTPYNQPSLVRTIELILGLPPMNQMDATATPMQDCFTEAPDLTPFVSIPNIVPLDEINPEPKKIADRALRKDAIMSAKLPLNEPDRCPEDVLNRILWRAMKGCSVPYPEWAVQAVADND